MIVLDTNVLSALMRVQPDTAVVEWLDGQPSESVWTTSVTVLEIRTGIELLSPSRRRQHLESTFDQLLEDDLEGRVLPFDVAAAEASGRMVAHQQRAGTPVEIRDAEIAGIALSRRATVATGNTRHFEELGVRLVNPWEPGARPNR